MKLKNINFGLRSLILQITTHKTAKRIFEKFLLEATKSVLEHLGCPIETTRTVCQDSLDEIISSAWSSLSKKADVSKLFLRIILSL